MHGPSKESKHNNILQQLLDNKDDRNAPMRTNPWSWSKDPKEQEAQARIRIQKLLRELDVMPVFLLRLESELYELLTYTGSCMVKEKELAEQVSLAKYLVRDAEKLIQKTEKCIKCKVAKEQTKEALSTFKKGKKRLSKVSVCQRIESLLEIWKERWGWD